MSDVGPLTACAAPLDSGCLAQFRYFAIVFARRRQLAADLGRQQLIQYLGGGEFEVDGVSFDLHIESANAVLLILQRLTCLK